MQSQINQESSLLRVILNEVKDHSEIRDVYVYRYCRRVILHFVQDDTYTVTTIPQFCIWPCQGREVGIRSASHAPCPYGPNTACGNLAFEGLVSR
jgi:hypothetical protein